ncbi:MAG TPA: hypothetical protein VEX43_17375 [Chthoniobacterales bacterium]|nr:hypothetical protein [Chthoniobacterales bacterium]
MDSPWRTSASRPPTSVLSLLSFLSLGLTGLSFVAVPLAVIWRFLTVWLGRKQVALLHASERQS